jgi:hypothetical protein
MRVLSVAAEIRPYDESDLEAILEVSPRAWKPGVRYLKLLG